MGDYENAIWYQINQVERNIIFLEKKCKKLDNKSEIEKMFELISFWKNVKDELILLSDKEYTGNISVKEKNKTIKKMYYEFIMKYDNQIYCFNDIENDINKRFADIRKYLSSNFPSYIGCKEYCSYDILVSCGKLSGCSPNSVAIGAVEDLNNYYLNLVKEYMKYINSQCEEMENRYLSIIENYVNKYIFMPIRNELIRISDELKFEIDEFPIEEFDGLDYLYEDVLSLKSKKIKPMKIVISSMNSIDVCWKRENLDRFWNDMNYSLLEMINSAESYMKKTYVKNINRMIHTYIRLSCEKVRKYLVDK